MYRKVTLRLERNLMTPFFRLLRHFVVFITFESWQGLLLSHKSVCWRSVMLSFRMYLFSSNPGEGPRIPAICFSSFRQSWRANAAATASWNSPRSFSPISLTHQKMRVSLLPRPLTWFIDTWGTVAYRFLKEKSNRQLKEELFNCGTSVSF
jgi:hypothetical protein